MQLLKRDILPACLLGLVSGTLSTAFLWSLDEVCAYHQEHSWMFWFMVPSGLFIAWLYHLEKGRSAAGNGLIQAAYRDEEVRIPTTMSPLIWLSTLLTHLAGGSAGREGTAVQMAVGQIGWFSMDHETQKKWINAGIAAGFSSVFGTPLAAIVFSFEYLGEKSKISKHLIPVVIASLVAHLVGMAWGVKHAQYNVLLNSEDQGFVAFLLLVFGIVFFLVGVVYKNLLLRWTVWCNEVLPNPFIRITIGALVLCFLYAMFSWNAYRGLSLPLLNEAFEGGVLWYSFLVKLLLTLLTLSFGFKGGDVTPLFVIGGCLGSVLAELTGIPLSTGAAAGMVTVFCSVYRTPLAGILLFVELFGWIQGITCGISIIPVIVFFEFSRGLKF